MSSDRDEPTVQRFGVTERVYHWVQAVPFLALLGTGGWILAGSLFADGDHVVSEQVILWHEVIGAAMPVGLFLTFVFGDTRRLLANLRCALCWRRDDLLWLFKFPLHAVLPRVRVPLAGRFNAGQKINLIAQLAMLPLFLFSGLWMWLKPGALLAWYVHVATFALAVPLILGHLYLALLHPSTRRGLSGVFSGRVPADWAMEHYPLDPASHHLGGPHQPRELRITPRPEERRADAQVKRV